MHILDQEFVFSPHYYFLDLEDLALDNFGDEAIVAQLKANTIFILGHTYKNKDYVNVFHLFRGFYKENLRLILGCIACRH